jgi:hypothetical protein
MPYDPNSRGGSSSMMPSNPFFGNGQFNGKTAGDWFSGKVAFDDMNGMFSPVQNDFQAKIYDPGKASTQIGKDYGGGELFNALRQAQKFGQDKNGGAQIAMGQQDQWRQGQQSLAQHLADRVNGHGGSVAQEQMNQGMQQAINAQRSQAASARGINPALAARMSAQNQGNIMQQTAASGGLLRAQEQTQAEQSLAGLQSQARGQDMSIAHNQAQLNQQNMQNNQNLAGQYLQAGMGREESQQKANAQYAQMMADQTQAANTVNASVASGNADREQKGKAGAAGAVGTFLGAVSDVRAKKEIQTGDGAKRDLVDFLEQQYGRMSNPEHWQDVNPDGVNEIAMARKRGELLNERPEYREAFLDEPRNYRLFDPSSRPDASTPQWRAGQDQRAERPLGDYRLVNASAPQGADPYWQSGQDQRTTKPTDPRGSYGLLDALAASKYKYKDPERFGEGQQYGVMAQDLEKTPVGRSFVETAPDGSKMVDYGKGFGAVLAAQQMLHERIKSLEGTKKGGS